MMAKLECSITIKSEFCSISLKYEGDEKNISRSLEDLSDDGLLIILPRIMITDLQRKKETDLNIFQFIK